MRRPKTDRVPRTRAGGTWTEAGFWGFIRSLLRRGFVRWPPRAACLKEAQRPYEGPDQRRKWVYECAQCGSLYKGTEVEVDHINPCGTLKSWDDIGPFARRLFCEIEGLQVVCKPCHKKITIWERER